MRCPTQIRQIIASNSLLIEKDMHGGIRMVSKRYVKANNTHVIDYNAKKETRYVM